MTYFKYVLFTVSSVWGNE